MPVAIIAAAAATASVVIPTIGFTGFLSLGTAKLFASNLLITAFAGLLSKSGKQQSQPSYQAEARDRLQVVRSSVDTRRVIYGQAMVSGPLVYAESTGTNNQYLHLVIPLAGHECEEIGDVYLNDELVGTLDGSGNVTTGRFAGYVRIKKHLGTTTQTADTDLVAESASLWTTNHRLRGIAYVYVRLQFDQNVFPNGIPNIKAVVKGKKIYDPRDGTTAWSDNWALCVRDYLTASYGLECVDAHAPHYLSLPGTSGSYASTPDSAALDLSQNWLPYSEDLTAWTDVNGVTISANAYADPNGEMTMDTLTDDSGAAFEGKQYSIAVANDGATYQFALLVRKDLLASHRCGLNVYFAGGGFTGTFPRFALDGTNVSGCTVTSYDDNNWLVSGSATNNSSGNTTLNIEIYPATAATKGGSDDAAATGSTTYGWLRVQRSSTLLPYKKTSGASLLGDIDIRIKVAANNWASVSGERLIAKRGGSGSSFDFLFGSGHIQLFTDGGSWPLVPLPTLSAGQTVWLRAVRTVSGGASTTFYYSAADDGNTWTSLGSAADLGNTGPLNDTAEPVEIGSLVGGTAGNLAGKIYAAEIRDGIDGDVIARFDAEDGENGDTSIVSSATGETWTINGSASLVAPAEGEIDDQALIAAANVCDEMVATVSGSPSLDQSRYTCNGTVNLADKPLDIMRQLMSAAAGAVVYSQGQYRVFAGAYRTPAVDLDESDLRGGIQVQPRRPRRELYNGVRGTFSDPDKFWQPTDFPAVTNSTYETQDGGQQILRDIELPFTTDSVRAQRIAKIHLEKSRQGITVILPCKYTAFKVAVWDTVRLSIERLGWVNKVFIVTGWKFSEAGGIDLELQEEASAVYDWAGGDATTYDAAPDTILPNPLDDVTITGLTAASGTAQLLVQGDGTVVPRIQLSWTAPANAYAKRYELQFALASGSPQDWRDAPSVLAPASSGFLLPVKDGLSYDCRVRLVTTVGNAGEWAYVYGHTVAGKTEVPSDVTGFSAAQSGGLVVFGANESPDADLDAIEIRLNDEGVTDYDTASPLTNILRGQTATSAAIPPGTWELLAKNRDTSGNYSATAARVTLTVTADGYTDITAQESAGDWQGALTNMVKHWTGVITPQSQSLASALGWEVFDQFVPNAYADCYFEAPAIDKSIDASARIYADIVSTLGPGETTGLANPSLEIDTKTTAGSYDGFESWTIGSVNFRYLKGRIYVDTTVGKPVISGFNLQIDAPSREESGTYTTPGGGSVAVSFANPFHTTPVLQVTPQGSGDVSASYASLTTSGFTGYFKTAGAAGAGTASYTATGA